MPRSFRDSRFRRRGDVGEDINPSAYIVNLADCMLVLAVGFAVALIARWNIPLSDMKQIEENDMKQIEADSLPEDITASGSYYQEAGKAYRDPNTGVLYIVEETNEADAEAESGNKESKDSTDSQQASSTKSGGSDTTDADKAHARAAGAD